METRVLSIPLIWPDMFLECEECSKRLQDALEQTHGVTQVTQDAINNSVKLVYNPALISVEEIIERARLQGATVNANIEHVRLRITGLDCPDCAQKLEAAIGRQKGVLWLSLNFASSILVVEYDSTLTGLDNIKKRILDMGYQTAEKTSIPGEKPAARINSRLILTIISGVLLVTGFTLHRLLPQSSVGNILLIISAVCGSIHAAKYGLLALLSFTLDTNFLMTVAAAGAFILGDYSEAASVMFLYSLGSTLESLTADKTRRSIYSLIESFPRVVHVLISGNLQDKDIESIQVGQIIVVKPGERIPLDGLVKSGDSSVDESPISGESVPVYKTKGGPVYAGSINGSGSLEIIVSSIFGESTISRVVKLVEEAQSHKAQSQSLSEKFGKIYTPCVVLSAVLLSILGPLIAGGSLSQWFHKSLVLLVVACPCALVISTPVAIVAAIGSLASKGILIKGGAHLETLGQIKTMGFDKTGTITTGKLQVEKIIPASNRTSEEVLGLAAAVESRSEHPIANAIVEYARKTGIKYADIAYFKSITGKGAVAVTSDGECFIGSAKYMLDRKVDISEFENIPDASSVVYVADENGAAGAIYLQDEVRPETAGVISALKKMGIERIALITGDNSSAAGSAAQTAGISEIYSGLLPEEKLAVIKSMSRTSKTALVGDGINDAPALAAAHVGIALRGLGNETAVQAADVVFMGDSLHGLLNAMNKGKHTRTIILQNTVISLLAVGILVLGAFTGFIGLSAGVFGHEGSALLVIANSMRLLK